jgi:hypothetical protein
MHSVRNVFLVLFIAQQFDYLELPCISHIEFCSKWSSKFLLKLSETSQASASAPRNKVGEK